MKKIIIVSILFLSAVSNIFAEKNTKTQEPLTLTVEDAVSYAITNSKSLKSSEIDLEIKKRAKMYSWNVFLPSVSVNAIASRSNEYSSMLNPGYVPTEKDINDAIAVGNTIWTATDSGVTKITEKEMSLEEKADYCLVKFLQ